MVWCYNESKKQLYVVQVIEQYVLGSLPSLPLCVRVPLLPFLTGVNLTTEGKISAVLISMKQSNHFPFFNSSVSLSLQGSLFQTYSCYRYASLLIKIIRRKVGTGEKKSL